MRTAIVIAIAPSKIEFAVEVFAQNAVGWYVCDSANSADRVSSSRGRQLSNLLSVIILDWIKVGVEWMAGLDMQALVLFRNELNYK